MKELKAIRLEDYAPPPFLVDAVDLDINFQAEHTRVTSRLSVRRNPAAREQGPLVLDGELLETLAVAVDGVDLPADRYRVSDNALTIADPPDAFELSTVTRIYPDRNTRLSGLYRAKGGYFTQCEAQGFRAITWFPDRPDVMSRYTVTLHADKAQYPLLIANGNPAGAGDEAADATGQPRHWARWHDPFAKPCYLFAVVAAKLDTLRDRFVTRSGRTVELAIHAEPGKVADCAHAMAALKKAMRWDEERFGLECDLDHYKIVVVGDFNMGAMENKGLNIFNSKYVLARPELATDVDYANIDRVVGHEYFHNWTGNRVTCRDWFQLSLKEGLTVYREQDFGADVHDAAVTRIREVRGLRAAQFPEDAGPMAHPVRPSSYVQINNFYTATVYQKGAEVVRMIETLIGRAAFRRGMDLYFQRHDGQAVTCDDFVAAMSDASGVGLTQFKRWYSQAGTPRVDGHGEYDPARRRYVLTLTQTLPARADNPSPYHIPVAMGLVAPDGGQMPLRLAGEPVAAGTSRVVSLTEARQTFTFEDVTAPPIPSLLRGFSAPVILDFPFSDDELAHLMAHDSDPVNRWEAGQKLASRIILAAVPKIGSGEEPQWPKVFVDAMRIVLERSDENPALAAEAMSLPLEATLAEELAVLDPDALHAATKGLRLFLTRALEPLFHDRYRELTPTGAYRFTPQDAGRRSLRNACLDYLARADTPSARALALAQFDGADNMTDQFAALAALSRCQGPERELSLARFEERWRNEPLVMDKWLAVQAASDLPDTLATVSRLTGHPAFDIRNPNKVYALLRSFGTNHARFHARDGAGYRFLAKEIARIDPINPIVAARLVRCFDCWRKLEPVRQNEARAVLEGLRATSGLSSDVAEIVARCLG